MKTAVVTGASTGIGREIAIALAKNDYAVCLIARYKKTLDQTEHIIAKTGGKAFVIPTDLSSIPSINACISKIKQTAKNVDLIANIAGVWHGKNEVFAGKDFETFDQNIILETFGVGIIAPVLLVHGLLPLMKKGSKIVNLSGTFESGAKGWLPYYVSKRAMEDFTVGLAQELEEKEIQVNCVSPSDTATENYARFFPQYMNEAISPKEIAKKFVELANTTETTTGKIIVMKKDKQPFEHFHY